ncbi:uncharacterized protein LOC131635561 [Vicia villosa]|uniref:uncharacterized protein LOC131613669 n=1 Tax=Vicia villosa TaxID=3911 RepID=UPI00273CA821|nr:uncharacterized protein LOC131613669 [Vicia villosa]XP_058762172.1 uncharacterized protein LOC131635561 [Vicia villosa]
MMSFGIGISMNCFSLRMSPSCYALSHLSLSSSFSPCSSFNSNKLNLIQKASSQEIPSELVEDSKFVPINSEDPSYGPPALLLLGFEADEIFKIRQFLKELEGDFLKVIYCTKDMLTRSLWEAMHTSQERLEDVEIDKSLPRICFLSGLSGEEMMMFVDAFQETGLKSAAFAALVPNSADKPLYELIEEITGDHEMLTGEQL